MIQSQKVLTLFSIFFLVIQSCAFNPSSTAPSPEIAVPEEIQYQGDGSAAAMMSAAMGPMGIAIGAAIEQGFGHDINKVFQQQGFTLRALVSDAFQQSFQEKPHLLQKITNITIHSIGYKKPPASGSKVFPFFAGTVLMDGKEIKFESEANPNSDRGETLEVLKADGTAVYQSLLVEMKAVLSTLSESKAE